VAGIIGDPVDHSLSPVLHNAAFREMGLDWVYVAFHVSTGQGGDAVQAMRALGISGLSVTMPHKAAAASALAGLGPDQGSLGPTARRLGVVNTVSWAGPAGSGPLLGDSTDGPGFIISMVEDEGFDPAGRRCVVLGAGGAARSVTLALADRGASSVAVAARNPPAASDCAALAGDRGRHLAASDGEALSAEVAGADLIVNATPVGMNGEAMPLGMDAGSLRPGQFVADLVYSPAVTPLISAARARGASASNGLGMLIRQAALQFETWTGRRAPLEVMSAAAVRELSHR
jgi:shikimate dehydrogenase